MDCQYHLHIVKILHSTLSPGTSSFLNNLNVKTTNVKMWLLPPITFVALFHYYLLKTGCYCRSKDL